LAKALASQITKNIFKFKKEDIKMIHIYWCSAIGAVFAIAVLAYFGKADPKVIDDYKKRENPKLDRFKTYRDSMVEMEVARSNASPEQVEQARRRNEAVLTKMEPQAQAAFLGQIERYNLEMEKMKTMSDQELTDRYTAHKAWELRWIIFQVACKIFLP
jgi:hypothetical protein